MRTLDPTTSQMWAPADLTALPDAKDLIDAKIAIEVVENEIKDAYLALAQTQRRIASLENDLYQRRAWIAPVRRLSFYVLAHLFEICGQDSWKMPLRISSVSRQWRNAALSTPRAWAFLPVHECERHKDLINHFFKHSGTRPLHVFLGKSQTLALLAEVIERLECLSVHTQIQNKNHLVFPRLKHLSVRDVGGFIELSDLLIARFPALRELIVESSLCNSTPSSPNSMQLRFPPLQVLSIPMVDGTAWLDLLNGCKDSLVSLKLVAVEEYTASRQQVILPLLKCLEVHNWGEFPISWPMDLRTPAIVTYVEGREYHRPPVHATPAHSDVGKVTRMRSSHAPNLAAFSLLSVLQIHGGTDVTEVLSQLQFDRSLCPGLYLIELMQPGKLPPYKELLYEVNRERPQPILIKRVPTWETALPHAISPSPVGVQLSSCAVADNYQCGTNMPCSG